MARTGLRKVVEVIYPPQCMLCGDPVAEAGLCGSCWRETPFLTSQGCPLCAAPLIGANVGNEALCDDCLKVPRPWSMGRAAMKYEGGGRRLVLGLKHGDRTENAALLGRWMASAAADMLEDDPLIVPVPVHWRRLVHRRYNQAALLSRAVARAAGLDHCVDLLLRRRATPTQEGRDWDGRFRNVESAISANPLREHLAYERTVVILDDVFTSGATFTACSEACLAAGAEEVRVLALARVVKEP
ncbi:MAG: ComF family protein [Pseudomonadota bacterium]